MTSTCIINMIVTRQCHYFLNITICDRILVLYLLGKVVLIFEDTTFDANTPSPKFVFTLIQIMCTKFGYN